LFLFPALTIGFLFVAVPPLVHLINMLRHQRRRWAAMDFLLQSYRKQKKWIRLRQLLLLLARMAIAILLIAMLCGWNGGGRALQMLGGTTTHHVVILDDSYSMGDSSLSKGTSMLGKNLPATAYGRSLSSLNDLITRLAADDGNHQLTVMRSSRAAMASRVGSSSGDAAADLSAQTVTSDGRLATRVMSTSVSPIRTDLSAALDFASDLASNTPADSTFVYIASDFRARDWDSPERLAASLRRLPSGVNIRMIDCAASPAPNLAVTDIAPVPDVWVAGVPVVINVTVKNYATTAAMNVAMQARVIRYGSNVSSIDPTREVSGEVESLPTIVIESLAAGQQITKTFQVFITETGTDAIEVKLPNDALAIDNSRSCTLPLSDAEKILVIDGDLDTRGAYHVASVLDPGSQVRIGAVPDVKPPSFLRSATWESLASYRAIYLIDLPEITESAAESLDQYVRHGGGLAWFLGSEVNAKQYNEVLLARERRLLPGALSEPLPLSVGDRSEADLRFGESAETLLAPLASAGEAALALVGVSDSWQIQPVESSDDDVRVQRVIDRRDGLPWVLQHNVGSGRVVTVLSGLDGSWTNWPGDPSFVVFMLQTNALLWSGAASDTHRFVDDPLVQVLPQQEFTGDVSFVPAADQPPRVAIELKPEQTANASGDQSTFEINVDPKELVIAGDSSVQQWLHPGISEWSMVAIDGSVVVKPSSGVIRVGEGDLKRADQAQIAQSLLPTEVKFVTSSAWSNQNQAAGSSALSTLLLGLLVAFLAAEQALAYWASYHVRESSSSAATTAVHGAGRVSGGHAR
jgi:hypothetical protein